ncbi:MAG TPA: TonB family protein [Thermoanaerobaculia bacterium]|nr:TonB family protein [Thermoanaerobaculia bacterium]
MDNRTLPYQTTGSFVLFRKLEEGALADLWRGAPLEGAGAGTPVALHRFKGGDPAALREAATAARQAIRQISGATIVREQSVEIADGIPILVHEYAGGRSLRGIVERAARPASPHPIPVDQSLAIAERISAALQALHSFRANGARLVHGAVIPQFVWITEDGEVRLAGQHLARGILGSLADRTVRAEIAPFLAPEIRAGGEPTVAGDVYSVGAILHLTLTGKPLAETAAGSLAAALDGATLQFDDEPIPPELRAILEKTVAADPAQRFASYDALHQELTRVASGGEYAPTTFNLAFYLHTLMKKEKEEEAEERRREQSADLAAIAARAKEEKRSAAAAAAPAAAAMAATHPLTSPLSQVEEKRSKAPLIAAAALLLIAAGTGAYYMLSDRGRIAPAAAAAPAQTATLASTQPPAAPILTAIADPAADTALTSTAPATATAALTDEEARKKAFEEEVNRRLQAEVARLQADYEKQLSAERSKAAPRTTPEPPPQQAARAATSVPPPPSPAEVASADRLNQQRLDQLRERPAEVPSPAAPAVDTAPAPARESAPATTEPAASSAPAVREGDLIELASLDRQPSLVKSVAPEYPPIAKQKKFTATVIVTALVTENGDVADVRILRGDKRNLGFDEAAMKAVRQAKFAPPMKDGKRVRTWLAMPVNFAVR